MKPRYDLASLFFSIGCLPLLFLPFLPSIHFWYFGFSLLIIVCLLNHYIKKIYFYIVSFLLIGFLWSTNSALEYLSSIEHHIDKKMTIKAEVRSVNINDNNIGHTSNYQYILFKIKEIDHKHIDVPFTISLLWKESFIPSSGQIWQLKIKTKVMHAYLNEGSFDSQRFAIANRRLLTGTVEDATLLQDNIHFRQRMVNSALPYFNLFNNSDVMFALAFGERSRLTQTHKILMFQTGIAHLMAISGMHIILVAYITSRFVRLVQYCFPIRLISYWQPLIVGWGCAVFYAWLTGLNLPATRAIIALSLWLIFRYWHIQLTPWQMINRIIAILLFIDPLMVLSESFWLSCYAVICLIFISQWFPLSNKIKK